MLHGHMRSHEQVSKQLPFRLQDTSVYFRAGWRARCSLSEVPASTAALRIMAPDGEHSKLPGFRNGRPPLRATGSSRRSPGHGSAPVVVDDLDVVPVRVEHECAVVAGVV